MLCFQLNIFSDAMKGQVARHLADALAGFGDLGGFENDLGELCRVEPRVALQLAIELCADLPADQSKQVERLTFSSLAFAKEYTDLLDGMRDRLSGGGKS